MYPMYHHPSARPPVARVTQLTLSLTPGGATRRRARPGARPRTPRRRAARGVPRGSKASARRKPLAGEP
eukprot:6555542-Prymnesium_polylepis.1